MQSCSSSGSGSRLCLHRCRTRLPSVRCQAAAAAPIKPVVVPPPYRVLITGSTKGIGRALAEEFLKSGDTVLVSSRSQERVEGTVLELQSKYGADKVKGKACNVGKAGEVRALADYAAKELGRVDIWINNAGSNAYNYSPLAESSDEDLQEIVQTNVLGVMLCCREAIRIMKAQETGGHVFNMDGAGADGGPTPRFAAYGATKRSLQQLGKSIASELQQAQVKHVQVHNLSPGMVTTELLMAGANTPAAKFFINCLAEPADVVADFLVPRIRKVPQESVNPLTSSINQTYIKFLTKQKAYSQIFGRVFTGARKNRFVAEDSKEAATS